MLNRNTYNGYATLLKNWVVFSQKHLYICPENTNYICYGAGEHGHWGVHTHQKAFSAFAVAATLDEIDFSDTNISKEIVLSQAIAMLRYTLHTHLEGDFVCTDGEKWGHNWIYVLGIERMFHGIEAIRKHLTKEDNDLLKKVIVSECEFVLKDYEIEAGLYGRHLEPGTANKPESNIWNGAILYRAVALYPDLENKNEYIKKARKFFANGISIPSAENSDEIVDGERIGDLFVGANMFESYACNHHRYLNIGYLSICLSNIAMLHFFLKSKGLKPDDIIYHHLKEQWELIYSTTFSDGRLWRIGGDSRARYCYCQDFALPMWALIEDYFGQDLSGFYDGWLSILKKECDVNGDGSFLSERIGYFENLSPVYYTRLESDRSNVISMLLYWYKQFDIKANASVGRITNWQDEYHGAAFDYNSKRSASFVWEAAQKPQGLLVPTDDSSFAEWRFNLTARILGVGAKNIDVVQQKQVEPFEGGFLTYGISNSFSDNFLAEGQTREKMAEKFTAFAALPDGRSILCIQYLKTANRTFAKEVAGTFWNVPNDIFNDCKRTAYSQMGEIELLGGGKEGKKSKVSVGNYVNFDNKIGIASKIPLTLVRRGQRQIEIRNKPEGVTLYVEEICAPYIDECRWFDRGSVVVDTAFAMSIGDAEETKQLSESLIIYDTESIRSVGVKAFDGKVYHLVTNVSDSEQTYNGCVLHPMQAVLLEG